MRFLRHSDCPLCGSTDNVGVWEHEDGSISEFCFTPGCSHRKGQKPTDEDYPEDWGISLPILRVGLARGIKKETFLKYSVGFTEDKLAVFPFFKDGRVIAYKERTKDKSYFGVRGVGRSLPLFGMQTVAPNRRVLIITEGEFDALAANQMTDWASVSVPNGAQGAASAVKRCLEWVEHFEKVYVCFDSDDAGETAADEVMKVLKPGVGFRVRLLRHKDPNDYLVAGDIDEFKEDLNSAQSLNPGYTYSSEETLEFLEEALKGKDAGWPTGFIGLDEVFSMRPSEVTTLFADPSVGKSSVARQIVANQLRLGRKSLVFTYEESQGVYLAKIIGMLLGKNVLSERRGLTPDERKFISGHIIPNVLFVRIGSFKLDELRHVVEYSVRANDVDVLVYDNVTAATGCSENMTTQISMVYTQLVDVGKQCRHHSIIVSHTKRDPTLQEGDVPSMRHGFGAGAIERFSDNVLALGRVLTTDITNWALRKQRATGQLGTGQIIYNKTLHRFEGTIIEEEEDWFEKEEITSEVPEDVSERDIDEGLRLDDGGTVPRDEPPSDTDTITEETPSVYGSHHVHDEPGLCGQERASPQVLRSKGLPETRGRKTVKEPETGGQTKVNSSSSGFPQVFAWTTNDLLGLGRKERYQGDEP